MDTPRNTPSLPAPGTIVIGRNSRSEQRTGRVIEARQFSHGARVLIRQRNGRNVMLVTVLRTLASY